MVKDNAVVLNPTYYDLELSPRGSVWLWTVFAIFAASTLAVGVFTFLTPRANRLFHYITLSVLLVGSISYFSTAANLGSTGIVIEFVRGNESAGQTRQVFYSRYIDWFVTTPLLLLDLLLISGVSWGSILATIFAQLVAVVCGLIGALTQSNYKWGYATLGAASYFFVVYQLLFEARLGAQSLGTDIHRHFISITSFSVFIWTLYTIAWGLSEGGNVISNDSEAIFYGILDLLSRPVFAFWFLFGVRNIALERLGLVGLGSGFRAPITEKGRTTAVPITRENVASQDTARETA